MKELVVGLGDRSYPIQIGSGLLAGGRLLPASLGQTNVVVTDTNVARYHLDTVRETMGESLTATLVLPAGEQHKTLASVEKIIDLLTEHRCNRDTRLIALGGGVIGDMTGFAAAIYLRGVAFIQLPTTLLSQVDSAVGGKTAVNHPRGKNLIGAFHQPVTVISDLDTLQTLEPREYRAGLAEVIKSALLADAAFFGWLEQNIDALLTHEPAAQAHAIARCCEIKADIVARDERENGVRALLNLGHTFGHAIESETGYGWLHGEAVAAGMVMAAQLSAIVGSIDDDTVERIRKLIGRAGLPTRPPRIAAERFRRWMQLDKKARAGRIRFILLTETGVAHIADDVPASAVDEVLKTAAGSPMPG